MYKGSKFSQLLREKPLSEWVVKDSVTLGWDDGTTCGVYDIEQPSVTFVASQIAYRLEGSRITERLFRIDEVVPGTVQKIDQVLETPHLSFTEQSEKVDILLQDSVETHLLFRSKSENHFDQWWYITGRLPSLNGG